MTENVTEIETPAKPKTSLVRKSLIVLGSTVGLLLAVGIVLNKKNDESCECEIDNADAETIDEYNALIDETTTPTE